MLSNEELEQRLRLVADVDYVKVQGDGYHYNLIIVSDLFINKSNLARQRWVYAHLKDDMTTGRLHALSMKTWTKDEWEKQSG